MKKKNAKVNTYISLHCTAYRCGHWNVKNLTGRNKIIDKKGVLYSESTAQIEVREPPEVFWKSSE